MKVTIGLVVLCLAVSAFADEQRNGRIVNGQITSPHAHPYLVGIIRRLSATATGVCGGSIISNFVILTSAQCLQVNISSIIYNLCYFYEFFLFKREHYQLRWLWVHMF